MAPFIKRNWLPVIVFGFILVGLILKNYFMRNILFWDWDEGIYAQIAAEVLKNKTFITTFNGTLWLDKPPLANILIAIMFAIFGRSEFWARMLMVVFGFTLLVLTYFLARKIMSTIFKDQIKKQSDIQNQIMYLMPVFVLLSFPIYLDRSTILNTDVILGISWTGYLLFMDNFYAKLFFLTFGVLSKSILGFYPLLFEVLTLKKKDFKFKNIYKVLLLILVPSVWHIFAFIKWGNYFFQIHFINQMVKRVAVPIELHFGDKFYYITFVWKSLGVLSIILVAAYLLIAFDLIKIITKKKTSVLNSDVWRPYIFLFSAIPFFVFLNLGKSKIYWYVAIMTPLMSIPFAYLYYRLKHPILRSVLVLIVLGYFLYNFIPQTYLSNAKYTPPEKMQLAICISKQPGNRIAVLVDDEERRNKNFLEAAHYDTNSSFLYGGSPSFVYYSQKKVDYFYDVDTFKDAINKYPLIDVSKNDYEKEHLAALIGKNYYLKCKTDSLMGFVK